MKIQLQPSLSSKKCVINIECLPNECFKYAVLTSLHSQDIKIHNYNASEFENFASKYDWSTTTFPVSTSQIKYFERVNPTVGIIALKWVEKDKPECIHSTPYNKKKTKTAVILLYNNHWLGVNIHRIGGLFRRAGKRHHAICPHCLNNFYNQDQLDNHIVKCKGDLSRIEMPKQNSCYQFQDFDKILPAPYCMYIDIEAILEKQETPTTSNTTRLQKHMPAAIGTLIIPSSDLKAEPIETANQYKSFVGVDCIREFRNYLIETCKSIYDWTKINSHMLANRKRSEDIKAFDEADKCQQCKRSFENDKVWHHNHNNGEFIGALCSTCNLKIEQSRRSLTIVWHNLKKL